MLRAIVLDFDGVIADTEPLHYRAFRDVLAGEGVDLTEASYYERYLGYSDVRAFEVIAADEGRTWTADFIGTLVARKARLLERLEGQSSVLFPGAEAFIRRASEVVPLAIASGALRAEIQRVLDRADLARCFAGIVAAEDVAASKPHPDPYRRAVELLARHTPPPLVAADCVAIEDSQWGIESARAAGLRTVGVTHSYDAAALKDADLVVPALAELDVTDLHRLVTE
jgi:HAD superfamily hydrolase (TIGR01509 family)